MNRREWLKAALAIPFLSLATGGGVMSTLAASIAKTASGLRSRVRPGDPNWPSPAQWDGLKQQVGGRLLAPVSPFADRASAAYSEALKHIKNPFFIGDQPALTQTSGWAKAWTSQPSVYAVAAESTADVVAAVNFAREHHLRLVVKGGGHSYQGTSDSADSLLVWTRHMNKVTLHDNFVAQGCTDTQPPQPAVTVQAGAMWIDAYDAVTTHGGRYVQGGGCTTVGVAGLLQSGGFGSFSKNFGTASSNLIEAEIVTADGVARIANACTNPELFWGIKGGGGGSLGVVTRLTLRTHALPEFFGGAFGEIKASSDQAYRALIGKAMDFYQSALMNPHWGEQMAFGPDNQLHISMVSQGLSEQQATDIWAPFLDWVRARKEYSFPKPVQALALPAQHFWDADFFRQHLPGAMVDDDRQGAPRNHVLWSGDQGQVGWFIQAFQSAWLPASLLRADQQSRLADAIFAGSRHHRMEFHFNKGLAGAPTEAIARARDTAMNPQVLDAFALAIIADAGDPAYPGMPGPDLAAARSNAERVDAAMDALLQVAPGAGAYVSESDYFQRDWQTAFWGTNYPRLAAAKQTYDPHGLFFVHHGVGSEGWSADGFTRLT
ncbi:FAD-binding oxidoreductase [Dyella caseinilytica]|uniref:FAD-binding oxidoreductase n=1 Tax=Dyella caseinilytica TaxID=1849581 RepID=A0ABX7GNU9_9GAMM|nr:FAD-binding oxidoreductase [Dyella caseinilytica]QRN52105.1 FAD-binding oxidoreductase [Dyella caseinilytica]GGA15353.1 FAD-binding protein [Dyella caseinilytica]